jgi:hypothetical protein
MDSGGNLWLFGGVGYSLYAGSGQPYNGALNDLWEFSPMTNEWAWMGGTSLIVGGGSPRGVNGPLGTFSAANIPGSRAASFAWVDSAGNAWLIGGAGFGASSGGGAEDDIWEFNPTINEWAWMGSLSTSGVFGTLGVAAPANLPGGRQAAATWTGLDGSFWMFGGIGVEANGVRGDLNDLWQYQAQLAAPAFSSPAGIYTSTQLVSLSDATSGATIFYTTNGTTPTTNSAVYSSPIAVNSSETIEAIATASGYSISPVASAAYTIDLPAATPSISVPSGTYTTSQTVSISDTTPNAIIYYTTNGTTPTTSSAVYSGPVTVSLSETLQAIATASGYSTSPVASTTYTIPPDFSVAATPASQTVAGGQYGTTSISITPANGFNSAVSFSCSGLPFGAACIFSPQTVTPSTGVASTTLNITTTLSMAVIHRRTNPLSPISAVAALVCCIGCKRRRLSQLAVLIMVGGIGLSLLNGCGNVNPGVSSAPQSATYTITVNATSGSLQHSTPFSLTVN